MNQYCNKRNYTNSDSRIQKVHAKVRGWVSFIESMVSRAWVQISALLCGSVLKFVLMISDDDGLLFHFIILQGASIQVVQLNHLYPLNLGIFLKWLIPGIPPYSSMDIVSSKRDKQPRRYPC